MERIEEWALALALILLMALPLTEIALRRFNTGIYGQAGIMQHLVLFIAMLGGSIASRDGRLLALSNLASLLKGKAKAWAQALSGGAGLFVAAVLCVGSVTYIRMTAGLGGDILPGVPLWAAKTLMPLGFALIAIRLWWHSGQRWLPRALVFAGVAALVGLGLYDFGDVDGLVWPLLGLLLLATACGAPIFATLGGAALILFWGWGGYYEESPQIVALNLYDLVKNPMLATLPLFTLAGYFLAQGNSSRRLIALVEALFGGVRGGAAIVTVLVCAFFTTFTGASGVTILALGGLLLPVLKSAGYDDRSSIGLLTGSGSLGVLFPPCLPLILYVVVASNVGASISLEQIFLGGLLPGTLLLLLTIGWGVLKEPPRATHQARQPGEIWRAIKGAIGEILLPVVALVSLFGGYATPIEAAAVSAFYAFLLYAFDAIRVRKVSVAAELPKVMAECGLLVGGVLLILGVAMGFTNYLVTEMIPDRAVEYVQATIASPLVFLLVLNLFLIVVGCIMDIFSAIIVIVPLIVPMGVAFGIDPAHLGIIFLANLQLGYITPPIGMNLFLASYRFEKPMGMVIRSTLPILVVFIIGVLLITYVPWLTTWLPRAFGW